ncbi:MarR family transcriptional regulator [Methylorubrum populi]|uniref:MarR family transcriptional regulator n=1 Tax=Methylorubrum rhodesianum TaxID=29427 RepID=A0ABU9Z5P9_9HYPH|nr:MarR family transcriptional regulator [Methylorubrum rhodesianum]MBK3405189.1 MarR family transcriptional regulator [Methylorubrum rhodesianum]MBY0138676.1 MarR family transcriptional regulator [Methylorubrum populi]
MPTAHCPALLPEKAASEERIGESSTFAGLDEKLCFPVYADSHALTAAHRPLLESHGLNYPHFLVLLALWENDGRSVKDLSERLHLDSVTLTSLLRRMEAAGLLRRRRNPADERHLLVELTENGRTLRSIVGEIRKTLICALGGKVGPVLELQEKVEKVAELLRAAPHLQPAA